MSRDSAIIYSDAYQKYELSPWHPMKPVRLMLTAELIRDYGLIDERGVKVIEPREASDEELGLVHEKSYIDKVRQLSAPDARDADGIGWGLGTGDNPIFVDMHQASATIAGGAVVAADAVMGGEAPHTFHFGGGLHHAHPARASGFCVYNDVAIAAAYLKQKYSARVLYLDFDAHHGDGVQNFFYGDPQVMTVSFHESGRHLFPGSGFTSQIGDGEGRGYAVNLPLEPGTADDVYLSAYDALVPPLARAFKPDIIITQNGCDGHWSDPLTHLSLTIAGFQELARRQHQLVHEVADGRWLASGGGGYQAYAVVPRAWTAHTAAMAEVELEEELPESWRELCAQRSGAEAPRFLTRGDEPPEADRGDLDRAHDAAAAGVAEIKGTVFPIIGAS